MSYPRDLDEIPAWEFVKEMRRRAEALEKNLCAYCGRSIFDAEHKCQWAGKMVRYVQPDEPHDTGRTQPVQPVDAAGHPARAAKLDQPDAGRGADTRASKTFLSAMWNEVKRHSVD